MFNSRYDVYQKGCAVECINAFKQRFHVSNNNRIKDPAEYNLLVSDDDVSANHRGEGSIVLMVTNVLPLSLLQTEEVCLKYPKVFSMFCIHISQA